MGQQLVEYVIRELASEDAHIARACAHGSLRANQTLTEETKGVGIQSWCKVELSWGQGHRGRVQVSELGS